MTTPEVVDAAIAIEEVLAEAGLDDALVTVLDTASAGATRSTLYIEIAQGEVVIPAVAQLRAITSTNNLAEADVEGALLDVASHAGVPTPHKVAAGFSDQLKAEVLVTSRVNGETIPRRVLRLLGNDDAVRRRLTTQCGRALAQLHSVDTGPGSEIPDLGDIKTAAVYLAQLEEALDELRHPFPTFRYGLRYLASILPAKPAKVSLVHGDFRNGNLIVDDTGLAAVLDWELAHLGDPMEDIAWLCLRFWRFGNDDLEVGGFGQVEDLERAYVDAGGYWDHEAIHWWTMARTIWWGQGLAAQAKRYADGESDSIVHAASGRRVVELEYDLLKLIGDHRGF